MAFPGIPTQLGGRARLAVNTAGGATKTFPDLSTLTKNAGDLLIAIIVMYDGNSTNAEFSNWGGGFTEFADRSGPATMAIGLAYKFSDGTEAGTFTVTTADTSTNDSHLILLSIPGAHASTPPEAGLMTTGTSAAANIDGVNPTGWGVEDTLWIAIGGCGETSTTGSFGGVSAAPTNYTDAIAAGISADVVGGLDAWIAFRQLNAGSEDPGAFAVDTSNTRNAALLVAVRPAAASPQTVDGATFSPATSFPAGAATPSNTLASSGTQRLVHNGDGLVSSRNGTPIAATPQDITVLWKGRAQNWNPGAVQTLVSRREVESNWQFRIHFSARRLQFIVWQGAVATDATSDADDPWLDSDEPWIRVDRDASTGDVTFSYLIHATNDPDVALGETWTPIGTPQAGPTGDLDDAGTLVTIGTAGLAGGEGLDGYTKAVGVYHNGTRLARPIFADSTDGWTSDYDTSGANNGGNWHADVDGIEWRIFRKATIATSGTYIPGVFPRGGSVIYKVHGATFTPATTFPQGAVTLPQDVAGATFSPATSFPTGEAVLQQAPDTPTGFTGFAFQEDIGNYGVNLDWDAVPGADFYKLYCSNVGAGGPFDPVNEFILTDSLVWFDILTGQQLWFELIASNNAGDSAPATFNLLIPVDLFPGDAFTPATTFPTGDVAQTASNVTLNGVTFTPATAFAAGTITATFTVAGQTFVATATFPQGSVLRTLLGGTFQASPTWPTGAVLRGNVTLAGAVFAAPPSFVAGAITTSNALGGQVFTPATTFSTGAVTSNRNLAGATFSPATSFPQGRVQRVLAPTTPFAPGTTFPSGTVTPGAVVASGVTFSAGPAFPLGTLVQGDTLAGQVFQPATSFATGSVTTSLLVPGATFAAPATFPGGSVLAGAVDVDGQVFTAPPAFPTGQVTTLVPIGGGTFIAFPDFPQGEVVGAPFALQGQVFEASPTFPLGSLSGYQPMGTVSVTVSHLHPGVTVRVIGPSGTVSTPLVVSTP